MKTRSALILTLIASLGLWSCNKTPRLSISNPLDVARPNGQVALTKAELHDKLGEFDFSLIPVVKVKDKLVTSQTDDLDQDGNWDELVFVYPFGPMETVHFEIEMVIPEEAPRFESKTNVHLARRDYEDSAVYERTSVTFFGDSLTSYQPNQMDGPAWENEKVAYRMYFDGRNARDVFAKRTPEIVLPGVGLNKNNQPIDNYHVLKKWGRDVLSVGNSLGAGGIAIMESDSLIRLGLTLPDTIDNVQSTTYQLINKGPVRAIFRLTYKGWNTGTELLTVDQYISIWTGSQAYETMVKVEGFEGTRKLITGLVNNNNDQPEINFSIDKSYEVLATHDKQTYNKEYYLGLALAVPKSIFEGWNTTSAEDSVITTTSYATMNVLPGEYYSYLVFSGCELQDTKYKDKDAFLEDVKAELELKAVPLVVE